MKRACVIGAGFGGLALAIRLQSAGIATTIVEAREAAGGRACVWPRDGFTFDGGPTVITDPACLHELWGLSGGRMAEDVELLPVSPFFRLHWTDGAHFDYSNDEPALRAEINRVAPGDYEGYLDFLDYARAAYEEGYVKLGQTAFLDWRSMARALPQLMKQQAWRSIYARVADFVKSEKLRQALSFHTLLAGGNPMTVSALHALTHKLEKDGGVWWARGGTSRLVAGMVALFERLGGEIRLGDGVARIHTLGNRATEVETHSGWRERFDAVASNADLMHTYRDLLADCQRGPQMARDLSRKSWSPSLFVVHFALAGQFPGVAHHSILFGPRYKGLLEDIFEHGVLSRDLAIYLHHPTVTDPSMAPEGHSTFYALVPVPHRGKLPIDWTEVGPVLEKRVLDEIGLRLIPDIHDRLVTKFHYAPSDIERDLSAYLGNGFSLEPLLSQSAWLRAHNRDDVIPNLYLVGAGTHPGAGIPGVVGSAKATAGLMIEDLKA